MAERASSPGARLGGRVRRHRTAAMEAMPYG